MRLPIIHVLLALLLACHSGFSAPAHAQARAGGGAPTVAHPGQPNAPSIEESTALKIARWDAEAELIESVLADGDIDSATVEGMRATLDAQRNAIATLAAEARTELLPLERQRSALGVPPDDPGDEPPDIAAQRAQLAARISAVETRARRLAQADARAAGMLDTLSDLRRRLFTRELFTRGPSPFEPGFVSRAVESFTRQAGTIRDEIAGGIERRAFGMPFIVNTAVTLLMIALALFFVVGVRRVALRRLLLAIGPDVTQGKRVLISIGVTLVRLLIPALGLELLLVGIWQTGLFGPEGRNLLLGLSITVLLVTGAYGLGGAYYSPHEPRLRLSSLDEAEAASAHRWLMALAGVIGLDRVLVTHGESFDHAIEWLQFLNTILLIVGGFIVWKYSRFIADDAEPVAPVTGEPPAEDGEAGQAEPQREFQIAPFLRLWARVLARLIALAAPLLAMLGYYAASRFVFYPTVFSGAVIGLCVLLFYAVRETVESLTAPAPGGEGQVANRMQLIPIIVGFLLICVAVPVLALIWGADSADIGSTWRAVAQGFRVGEVTIAPLSFVSFLLVFSIGYLLTGLLQRFLSVSVLPVTGLDAGGRAAVSAGVFYLGVVLSALIAISTTGLDLSNVAIVAGALSVGIGFGLQNIVNNFISGIILLIERPIKAGDWVELGSGSGYVRQINVRSTEIETFDRAALIVPNSELISGPVTNWTHNSLNGRLIVPIGVAYGTDPRMVATMLTEIARAHPMLLRHPAPFVLFRRFGADALEFEIRGVLRDVNWILNVASDINFEIARRFAEAGIEIPFAQRDLHLRNAGELGRSIGEAVRGESGRSPDPDRTEES